MKRSPRRKYVVKIVSPVGEHTELDAGEQEIFAGIGATWNINDSYSVRFEYQRYLDVGDDESGEQDVDLLAIGMMFR